ncbi:MAG: flagellin lysine-N-methylase [Bacilli bacterium]|nr:flagellin lysine-N-methylase [Bacilli bacterium]
MKLRLPNYYKQFHCIANECKENCCTAGWEIDIDTKSANFYNSISGKFGDKLHTHINFNTPSHFILDNNNKCPFLNSDNLCEIYINLGKDCLCEICTEHPRYYEWFDGVKEGGIGLCCEEVARIILSQTEPFSTYEVEIPYEDCDEYDTNVFSYLINARAKILSYLNDDTRHFDSRIHDVLWYCYTIQQNLDSELLDDEEIFSVSTSTRPNLLAILNFFLTLEHNDANWIIWFKNCINNYSNSLDKMEDFEKDNPDVFQYLKNISIYFIWRYFLKGVFDGEVLSKVKLMVVSIAVIKFLLFCKWLENGVLSFEDCIWVVKKYSEEVEYSDDNLIALAEASYDEEFFSVEGLLGT